MSKVGILISAFRGGAELLETNLSVELSKLGYQVVIMPQYSENKLSDTDFNKEILKRHNVSVFRLATDKKIKLIYNLFKARQFGFDFLISLNPPTHILSSFISVFSSCIEVKALHGYFYPEQVRSNRGYAWYKSKASKLARFIRAKVWRWSLKSAEFTYHISNFVRKVNTDTFGLIEKRSCVVKNAINLHEVKENINLQSLGLPDGKRIILTVSRVVENKGLENSLRIVQPLLSKTKDLIYVVAGDTGVDKRIGAGDKDTHKKLCLLSKELKINDKVYFIGQIRNPAGLMRESKVFLHFAEAEGFGLVLLEAIREGLPVVASNIGGIPEVLSGTDYKCFDFNDLEGATSEINKYLLSNKRDLKDYSEYLSNFTHEKRALHVSSLLKKFGKQK